MKQLLRRNVFETNSSSMHSVVISKFEEDFTEEEIKDSFRYWVEDGIIDFTKLDDDPLVFERAPFQVLFSYFDKLRYYLASMAYIWSNEDYAEYAEKLNKLHPFVKGFKFGKDGYYADEDDENHGHIDHQSSEELSSFLFNNKLDIETFLKSKKYVIIVDGDEYCIYDRYEESGLITHEYKQSYTELTEVGNMLAELERGSRIYIEGNVLILETNNEGEYPKEKVETEFWQEEFNTWMIDDINITESNCYYEVKDKLELLVAIYGNNYNKLKEIKEICLKNLPIKNVIMNKRDFLNITMPNYVGMLLECFLEDKKITLTEFLTKPKYIVITGSKDFLDLVNSGLIDYHKIIDMVDTDSYDFEETI